MNIQYINIHTFIIIIWFSLLKKNAIKINYAQLIKVQAPYKSQERLAIKFITPIWHNIRKDDTPLYVQYILLQHKKENRYSILWVFGKRKTHSQTNRSMKRYSVSVQINNLALRRIRTRKKDNKMMAPYKQIEPFNDLWLPQKKLYFIFR